MSMSTHLFIYFEGGELCSGVWENSNHLCSIAFVQSEKGLLEYYVPKTTKYS